MALIIETGSGVVDANSYVSLADAQAFVDARELVVTLTEGLLLRAMDALCGVRGLADKYPLGIASDGIDDGVIRAQIWLAYYIEQGSDPAAIAEPGIKREKVDVIEIEYAVSETSSSSSLNPLSLPNVRDSLAGLLNTGLTGRLYHA